MADERTYIKLHDGMPEHPKVEALDDDVAAWLLVAAWAYCSRFATNGQVPKVKAHRLTKGASLARCRKLLAAGLLHDGPSTCCPEPKADHYYCHDYLAHQRSAEQIEAMKEQRRSAGRSGGLARSKRVAKQVAKQTAGKTQAVLEGSSNEEPQTEEASGTPAAPPRLDVEQICTAVVAAEVSKGSKKPTVTDAWRTQARLMLDSDGRDLGEVLAVIEWTRDHAFWRANIRSVPKLRDQFDMLRLQRDADRPKHADRELHPHKEWLRYS